MNKMNMMNEFSKVCVSFAEGMVLYNKTMTIYNFLNDHRGKKFSPKEIAETLGYGWNLDNEKDKNIFTGQVVKPLHWLLEMGVIKRDSYTTTITIPTNDGYYKKDVKIIDGIEYTAKIWVGGDIEKEVTSYKWYVE